MASNGLSQRLMMLAHVSHHRRSERSRTSSRCPTMTSNGAKVLSTEASWDNEGNIYTCVTTLKRKVEFLHAFWSCHLSPQGSSFIVTLLII